MSPTIETDHRLDVKYSSSITSAVKEGHGRDFVSSWG